MVGDGRRLPLAAAAGLALLATLAVAAAQAPDPEEKPRYISLPLGGLLRTGRRSLGLVPFPRVGKRVGSTGLVPFPRVGRAHSMGLVPFPRVGRARSVGLVPFPRVGRAQSMGLVPFPRVGRMDPAMDKRQSLIPYPRIGKKSLVPAEAADEETLWSEDDPVETDALQPAELDEQPSKRNWDAPRLGGYKRSGCQGNKGDTDCFPPVGRQLRLRSPLVPRLGGE